jgi:hypothetical protein
MEYLPPSAAASGSNERPVLRLNNSLLSYTILQDAEELILIRFPIFPTLWIYTIGDCI